MGFIKAIFKFIFAFILGIIVIITALYFYNKALQTHEVKIYFDDGSYITANLPADFYKVNQTFGAKAYLLAAKILPINIDGYDVRYIETLGENGCGLHCVHNRSEKKVIVVGRSDKSILDRYCQNPNQLSIEFNLQQIKSSNGYDSNFCKYNSNNTHGYIVVMTRVFLPNNKGVIVATSEQPPERETAITQDVLDISNSIQYHEK